MVNSFRKKKVPSGSFGFTAFEMFASAVYIDPRHVSAIMAMRMMKRQLLTWSEISFFRITVKGWRTPSSSLNQLKILVDEKKATGFCWPGFKKIGCFFFYVIHDRHLLQNSDSKYHQVRILSYSSNYILHPLQQPSLQFRMLHHVCRQFEKISPFPSMLLIPSTRFNCSFNQSIE